MGPQDHGLRRRPDAARHLVAPLPAQTGPEQAQHVPPHARAAWRQPRSRRDVLRLGAGALAAALLAACTMTGDPEPDPTPAETAQPDRHPGAVAVARGRAPDPVRRRERPAAPRHRRGAARTPGTRLLDAGHGRSPHREHLRRSRRVRGAARAAHPDVPPQRARPLPHPRRGLRRERRRQRLRSRPDQRHRDRARLRHPGRRRGVSLLPRRGGGHGRRRADGAVAAVRAVRAAVGATGRRRHGRRARRRHRPPSGPRWGAARSSPSGRGTGA